MRGNFVCFSYLVYFSQNNCLMRKACEGGKLIGTNFEQIMVKSMKQIHIFLVTIHFSLKLGYLHFDCYKPRGALIDFQCPYQYLGNNKGKNRVNNETFFSYAWQIVKHEGSVWRLLWANITLCIIHSLN